MNDTILGVIRPGAFVVVLSVTVMLAAVSANAATTREAVGSRARCGAAIPRTAASGPIVGPIQFRGIRLAGVPAQKILLILRRSTAGTVTVTGARCADNTPMRFFYNAPPPAVFTSKSGVTALAIRGREGDAWTGYTLWSKPGDWTLTVRRGGNVLGSLVFCVAQTALGYSTAPCA